MNSSPCVGRSLAITTHASSASPVSPPRPFSPTLSVGGTSMRVFLPNRRIPSVNRLHEGRTEGPRIDSRAVTRLSRYFLPTVKEAPADAEAVSHQLVVRAGLARQVAAGLWTFLPAGWRAHRRVEQIIREELDAIGSGEMLMPVLQPAEPWRKTGRYDIDEIFKLKDRRGADLVLAMTHEEILTWHIAREVRSYRDLPKLLYHFQTKERDEPRPRAGLLRTREFIMKDAYSFDRDLEGLEASYQLHIEAYDRIFDRSGLEWYRVEGDVGMMGGVGAHEYMAPCAAGENEVALSDSGYAANVEIASATAQPVDGLPEGSPEPVRVETPGATTIDAVAGMLGVPAGALIKAMPGLVAGANETDVHLSGVEQGRDFDPSWGDIRRAEPGDTDPSGRPIRIEPAIEVGNIFKLGTRYSEPLGARYLDEQGREQPIWMGSYGIGPARIMAAAIEQFADEQGISWPRAIAPFDVELVTLGKDGEDAREVSDRLYDNLRKAGLDVLYDEREASAGEKFADAELLGCPLRLTVGRKSVEAGELEVQVRRGQEKRTLGLEGAADAARELWESLP